jgi:redox-sensitive bicupin YhaK (pirin superfamily)
MYRKVKKYFEGRETQDGAGVKLRRCFGYHQIPDFDPFLMMDFFDSTDPADYSRGFPWHPHRGIETVTYLIKGEIEHGDSIGSSGVIRDGQCQWMTAGSGILHQELPQPSDEMLGVQVWLNLAADNKMTEPQYGDITEEMIPIYEDQHKKVHIIAGEFEGLSGEIQRIDTKPTFFDVELKAKSEFIFKLPADFNAYAFLIRGQANFNPEKEEFKNFPQGVLYESGEEIKVNTGEKSARFLFLAGKKLEEPVAWGGPIVMNTREELAAASRELNNGTFIKNKNEKNIKQVNKFYQET